MTLSPQQQEWHDKCYAIYKAPPGRTKKGMSLKAWAKVNPDEQLFKQIYDWILAFNRYQKAVGETLQYNRGFQVWLNNQGWIDDIPSVSEEKEKQKSGICIKCNKNEVIGPRFRYCHKCFADRDNKSKHGVYP